MHLTDMAGERYREVRKSMGLTQAQLAGLLGVHEQTVSQRERGVYPVSREAALAIQMLELEMKYELEFLE